MGGNVRLSLYGPNPLAVVRVRCTAQAAALTYAQNTKIGGTDMVSRRGLLIGGGVLAIGAGYVGTKVLRNRDPAARPAGVPVGPFGRKSTAEEVTAGLDLTGKTYLVTGGTSGLGLETTRVLASRGAHVLVTGRTTDKAAQATASLQGRFTPLALELTEFDSAVRCAEAALQAAPVIDGVICNAGIMELPTLEQVNGLEKQFVTNHLGHFVLVNRLIDAVKAAPQGRVVVVSSGAYMRAPEAGIEFDNLSGERNYTPASAYGQSKLANALFSRELARRLQGTNATSNALKPGVIMTNLGRHMSETKQMLARVIGWTFMRSVPEGAATQCYVATHPQLARVSGQFFSDCNAILPGGHMEDDAMAAKLWAVSEEITRPYLAQPV